tara:strand:+ start:1634 stop:1879 length:246 start_codon:yes stop_codon:yes gene_type:complete
MCEIVKVDCPVCHKGTIEVPRYISRNKRKITKNTIAKRLCIQVLTTEGYSIREISKMLNYKSPSSVHKIIKELQLTVNKEK